MSAPPIDVAVGVVFRGDGAVLLGQRPPGKPYAGWWEFPGGKLEAGETVAQALARELHEELGIEVRACAPWVVREFSYPHARVRLHFRRVTAHVGEPCSREGQAFAWLGPESIDVAPLLPATVPVIAWLRLPAALCASAAATLGEEGFIAALRHGLDAGKVPALLLDEPALAPDAFDRLLRRALPLCRAHRVRVLIGPLHPVSFARAADGALAGRLPADAAGARALGPLAAVRLRDPGELHAAAAAGLDFAVLASTSGALREAFPEGAPLPVYLDPDDEADARLAHAAGMHCVVRGARFWQDLRSEEETTMDLATIQARFASTFPGLMGVTVEEATPERVVATMRVRPDLCTAGSTLHGGAFMAFADTLGALATVLNLPAGARTTTIESKTNFMSGAPVDTAVRAVCTPLHRGRSTMVWQTEVTSEAGKRCAIVIQTQMVLPAAT